MIRLSADDLEAIKRQGFVSREVRGREMIVFKLRFRLEGRQKVKYLGTDPQRARKLEQELRELQRDRHTDLALAELNREAAALLRQSVRQIEPWLEAAGLHFHGRSIRKRRRKNADGVRTELESTNPEINGGNHGETESQHASAPEPGDPSDGRRGRAGEC